MLLVGLLVSQLDVISTLIVNGTFGSLIEQVVLVRCANFTRCSLAYLPLAAKKVEVLQVGNDLLLLGSLACEVGIRSLLWV